MYKVHFRFPFKLQLKHTSIVHKYSLMQTSDEYHDRI